MWCAYPHLCPEVVEMIPGGGDAARAPRWLPRDAIIRREAKVFHRWPAVENGHGIAPRCDDVSEDRKLV